MVFRLPLLVLTLEGTAAIVTPKGTEGLSFHNEAKQSTH